MPSIKDPRLFLVPVGVSVLLQTYLYLLCYYIQAKMTAEEALAALFKEYYDTINTKVNKKFPLFFRATPFSSLKFV